LEFLREASRRSIAGTPKLTLRNLEQQLLKESWRMILNGLDIKLCTLPRAEDPGEDSAEEADSPDLSAFPVDLPQTFIRSRSRDRSQKVEAFVE